MKLATFSIAPDLGLIFRKLQTKIKMFIGLAGAAIPPIEVQDLLVNSFELLCRRPPTEQEAMRLQMLDIFDVPEQQHVMRRIIAASDRNIISTPFLIRFGHDDVVWKNNDGFELALDAADIAVSRYVGEGVYEPHLNRFSKE